LLDSSIDLRSDPGLGRDYEISTVAHKLYERGSVPPDAEIEADLEALLAASDRYITLKESDSGVLAALAEEFRQQRPYPNEGDKAQTEARSELQKALARENLEAVQRDPSKYDSLQMGRFAASAYGGAGQQSQLHTGVSEGGDAAKSRLARSLWHLLYDVDVDEGQRIDDLTSNEEWRVRGLGESLAVKALAVVYPDRWLPAFVYGGDRGKKRLIQIPELELGPIDEQRFGSVGALAVESNRRLREVLEPLFSDDPWGQVQFAYWLRSREAGRRLPPVGLESLADELLLDREWLSEVVELLRDRRQIIFYGPPGTGKTYVARKLAEYIAQDLTRVEVVQFHPSYAYEDFVEGYRPKLETESGAVSFELRPGPLRQIAEDARKSEADWCLVIDEINRGNIAKIFGELYYLLEYRGDEIRLQYGDAFGLPANLYIIGTMNTADRSIALLDAALRRRFHFVAFFPDQPPIEGLLLRWLTRKRPGMEYVAELVDKVNSMLPDRHLQIGPSHFMTARLDDAWLEKIWRGSVLPYIEEQFFDEPERVAAFRLQELRPRTPAEPLEVGEPSAGEPSTPEDPGVAGDNGHAER
jgi:5-methylcytosine-specific restriction protein B